MKKVVQILMSVMLFCMMAGLAGQSAEAHGVPGWVGTLGYVVVAMAVVLLVPKRKSPFSVSQDYAEIFLREVINRLFKNNAFLSYATNEDEYVIGGRIVHIPQPGARPVVTKNRDSYPAVAVRRSDSDVNYQLDEYTTAPSHLPFKELANINYDKLSSMITDHFGYLIQDVADDMLYKWADGIPQSQIVTTTGGASEVPVGGGQTGSRLVMKSEDLKRARLLLNKQNVPVEGRVCVLPSDMLDQLMTDLAQTQYRDFSKAMDEKTGSVGTLYGFTIIERATAVQALAALDGSNTLQALEFDAVLGATDNLGALCYHPMGVSRALGERVIYTSANRPEYYGDLYSSLIRMGGRRRREDNAGVVAIIQGTPVGA